MLFAVAQFTAITTNSEKATYFLSLRSCSIYKLKPFMLCTGKNVMFTDFTWKKIFCSPPSFSPRPCFMASLDIQSLFTNIPLDETIGICVNMVFEKRKKVKGMLKCHFRLIFSVKSPCFLFNGVYYKQIELIV